MSRKGWEALKSLGVEFVRAIKYFLIFIVIFYIPCSFFIASGLETGRKGWCIEDAHEWIEESQRCCVYSVRKNAEADWECVVFDDDEIYVNCAKSGGKWDGVVGRCCKKWDNSNSLNSRKCLEYWE